MQPSSQHLSQFGRFVHVQLGKPHCGLGKPPCATGHLRLNDLGGMHKSLYTGLSCSPQYGGFVFGSNPGPSDLDNLIAGGERKLSDLGDQAIFECLLGGDDVKEVPRQISPFLDNTYEKKEKTF